MQEVLKGLDELVFEMRNKGRYIVKGIRKGNISTLFGDIEYCRRYYFDKETGRYIHLLDEALGLDRARISPGLAIAAVIQAVIGPSYRAAREVARTREVACAAHLRESEQLRYPVGHTRDGFLRFHSCSVFTRAQSGHCCLGAHPLTPVHRLLRQSWH